jgi:hypothetical protein
MDSICDWEDVTSLGVDCKRAIPISKEALYLVDYLSWEFFLL